MVDDYSYNNNFDNGVDDIDDGGKNVIIVVLMVIIISDHAKVMM